jgi:PAS domain S-box-containing protein
MLRILLIDDNPQDRALAIRALEQEFADLQVKQVINAEDLEQALSAGQFDLVITDYQLRWSDGLTVLKEIKTRYSDCPVVMFTNSGTEEVAVEAMKSGLDDYVIKSANYVRLSKAVRLALERFETQHKAAGLEIRLQTLLNQLNVGVYRLSADGTILEGNLAFVRLLGLNSLTEISANQTLEPYFQPEDYAELLSQLKQNEGVCDRKAQLRRADGSAIWVRLSNKFTTVNGTTIINGLMEDISDRKQAISALRESEARFRLIVESAKDYAIFTLDMNGYVTSWNSGAQCLLGYEEAEIVGRDSRIIFTPEDNERNQADREMQKALLEGRAVNERWHVRKGGSRFWGSGLQMPLRDESDNVQGFLKIMRDKTEQRQAAERERFLAEASSVLATSIDDQTTLSRIARLAVPILADCCFFDIVTADNRIERVAWYHVDPAKQEWFAQIQRYVPPQDFQDYPVANVFHTGKSQFVSEIDEDWMQAAAISAEHLQFMRECQFCSSIAVPLIAHNRKLGALTFWMTAQSGRHYTSADLTLAEELAYRAAIALDNAQLYHQAQDANRIKDEFLAVLSHELRSPLNSILGWAKLLRTRKFNEATTARALETIERNAALQTQLIEDLLDVSRILRGKISLNVAPVNLISTISAAIETVSLAAQAKNISLEFLQQTQDKRAGGAGGDGEMGNLAQSSSPSSPLASRLSPLASYPSPASPASPAPPALVLGDTTRLQQVFWNLLSNAIKFTPIGGRVRISLERNGSYAQIQVSDTGKGIRADFLPHVFECFRQSDASITRTHGGLGLGLAIVRHLVELHGGTVKAESSGEGQGATFTVKIPMMEGAGGAGEAGGAGGELHPSPLTGVQILVVDDETDTREFLTFVLDECGAKVTAVSSAAEALEALQRFQPDALVSDIGMPNQDGYSLIRKLRALESSQERQIPAVALTAYARAEDRQEALAAGFQVHVSKPVNPDQLIAVIASLTKCA